MTNKIKLAILSPASIAMSRFLPALKKSEDFEFAGVAVADENEYKLNSSRPASADRAEKNREKTDKIVSEYGGKVYSSFMSAIEDPEVDAVYIPLPPALHFRWAKEALEHGKHVLLEKPFTTKAEDTAALIEIADKAGLAIHENYMFQYHSQLAYVENMVRSGEIGQVRLFKMAFGFPKRGEDDFRYNKELGGGALLDCGGYPISLAHRMLGETAQVRYAKLISPEEYDVDVWGSVVMDNAEGTAAQISFGMDNAYQCSLEVWGSKLTVIAPRVFTAPAGFAPQLIVKSSTGEEIRTLDADDQFLNSVSTFAACIKDETGRTNRYKEIYKQAALIEAVRSYS